MVPRRQSVSESSVGHSMSLNSLCMLLLQQAISELDVELNRLRAIRSIVAGLATAATQPRHPQPPSHGLRETEPASREVPTAPTQRRRVRKVRAARMLKVSTPKPRETTALGGVVPSRPVAISVQALQRERDDRAVVVKAEEPGRADIVPQVALDALSRDLTARWLSASAR